MQFQRNPDHAESGPVGVVVFQLGGPDSLESVEPFLYNLFLDPDIIDFPFARLARPTLARLISTRRARHVRSHYASIGGKSPIRELTERQAAALERKLRESVDARVLVAMRYWHPLTEDAVRRVNNAQLSRLVLLPLYPQYSRTTTGSSLNEWYRHYGRNGHAMKAAVRTPSLQDARTAAQQDHRKPYPAPVIQPLKITIIEHFYDDACYVDSVVQQVNTALSKFTPASIQENSAAQLNRGLEVSPANGTRPAVEKPDDVYLVFSAHGVPLSVIEAGDPYQQQVEATVKLVMARGGWSNPHRLCYQSRVGPGRWLQPTLDQTLGEIASGRGQRVLVIPISFVSDHVETLSEINIEAREVAAKLGIGHFEMMPALNDSPQFIAALARLVLHQLSAPSAAGKPLPSSS